MKVPWRKTENARRTDSQRAHDHDDDRDSSAGQGRAERSGELHAGRALSKSEYNANSRSNVLCQDSVRAAWPRARKLAAGPSSPSSAIIARAQLDAEPCSYNRPHSPPTIRSGAAPRFTARIGRPQARASAIARPNVSPGP